MFKLYMMHCPRCSQQEEMLVEYDMINKNITEEVLCEQCHTLMKPRIDQPIYGKHGSWSEWRLGVGT